MYGRPFFASWETATKSTRAGALISRTGDARADDGGQRDQCENQRHNMFHGRTAPAYPMTIKYTAECKSFVTMNAAMQ
jgi:GTPase